MRIPWSSGLTVQDVMVRRPKTLQSAASVGDVRAVLADDHVHMVLLVEDGRLRGTLLRDDLPTTAGADEPALAWSRLTGRTVPPDADAEAVRIRLVEVDARRRAVVGKDGRLLGLLCLKRHRNGFCSDADVDNRRHCAGMS